MKISWFRFLETLGCEIRDITAATHPCPFHKDTEPTLTVYDDTYNTYFECSSPSCKFQGDPITLAARWYNLSFPAAQALFEPGNQLHGLVIANNPEVIVPGGHTDHNYLIEYTNPRINQEVIEQFILKCHNNLVSKKYSECQAIMDFFTDGKWLHSSELSIHKDVGYVHPDDVPRFLHELNIWPLRKPHIILGLRYDEKIVGFKTINIRTGEAKMYPIIHAPNYIFMGDNITQENNTHMYIAANELAAIAIHNRSKLYTSVPFPIITMTHSKLPKTFDNVKIITLIHSAQHPLSLQTAVNIFNEDYGKALKHVFNMANEITETPFDIAMRQPKNKVTACRWIANEIIKHHTYDPSLIFNALQPSKLTEKNLHALLTMLTSLGAPIDLLDNVTAFNNTSHEEYILPNGNMIYRTSNGIIGRTPKIKDIKLSNVDIRIHNKYVTHDNIIYCNCTLSVENNTITTALDSSSFITIRSLKKAIEIAFAQNGIACTVAFYSSPGFSWAEIRDVLVESPVVNREIPHLGMLDSHVIHFPECVITNTEIKPQEQIYTLDINLMNIYAGIRKSPEVLTIDHYHKLWRQEDPIAIILSGVISHLIYCIFNGKSLATQNILQPTHLFLVQDYQGVIDTLYNQIVYLFAGANVATRLPYTKTLYYINGAKTLGSLPLITQLPDVNMYNRNNVISNSPRSLISVVDGITPRTLSDMYNASYMFGTFTSEFDPTSIQALQREFPYFLQELLNADIQVPKAITTPAIPIYTQIAEYLEAKPLALDEYLKPHYVMEVPSIEQLLFKDLYSLVTGGVIMVHYKTKLPNMYRQYDRRCPPIYIIAEKTYIPKDVIFTLNSKYNTNYTINAVEYQMKEAGILLERTGHYWVISKERWVKETQEEGTIVFPSPRLRRIAL